VNVDVGFTDFERTELDVRAGVQVTARIRFVEPGARVEREEDAPESTDGGEAEPLGPFDLALDVHGIFVWNQEMFPPDEALAKGWLEYNGMYLLWPYLRSYVTMITAATHFPALTIYTMNVPQPPVIPPKDVEAEVAEENHQLGETVKDVKSEI